MKNQIYTLLTSAIILLGKIRDRICSPRHGGAFLRLDRCIPWCDDFGKGRTYIGCCDCGLTHFVVIGHSLTPVRPIRYRYKMRFGANAWTKPNAELATTVWEQAKEAEVV